MWNSKKSVTLSIVVCFAFLFILTAAMFIGPYGIKMWLTLYRGFNPDGKALHDLLSLFKWCFYPCSVFAYVTLYSLIKLLFNIKAQQIFIVKNVAYLRVISWCCFAVALITLIGGCIYIPFMVVAVAAAFMGLMLRVVKNVMQNAVEIKAENELTI
ncbi:MAG: DUF2975 domain-containing protein [Clostridia bacterium]|nr:DUF2975 domain-containing protein [Clostridia bacterium]